MRSPILVAFRGLYFLFFDKNCAWAHFRGRKFFPKGEKNNRAEGEKRTVISFLLFAVMTWPAASQLSAQSPHEAVLWRGFEHRWSYNHRLNRFGSFVVWNDGKPFSAHASATGIGADSTRYKNHYTQVHCPDVVFQPHLVELTLDAREGNLVTQTLEVAVRADSGMARHQRFVVLFNGFDITAREQANKPQILQIFVGDGYYAPEVNEIRFTVHVSFLSACRSLECARFNQKVMYRLRLQTLILGGDDADFRATPLLCTKDYVWDRRYEMYEVPEQQLVRGYGQNAFPVAAMGLKSISLMLDQEHWLVEWNHCVVPLSYDAERGEMNFSSNLFFKEWEIGMKRFSFFPKFSRFSQKRAGWAVLGANAVLLQFRRGEVRNDFHEGRFFWPGRNGNPDRPPAVDYFFIKK